MISLPSLPIWLSVSANAPEGTVVGSATACDADTDTTFSLWQAEYSSGGIFAIDPSTGVITVADAAALSAVPKGTELKLFVSVLDGYQRRAPGSVSIEVRYELQLAGPAAPALPLLDQLSAARPTAT